MFTFVKIENGKIARIVQSEKNNSPGEGWRVAPNGFGGSPGDRLEWFDSEMRRITDSQLTAQGKRADCRGKWHSTENPGETKIIYNLDEEPGDGWTRLPPLENEPYQKWDGKAWAADAAKKAEAEKETAVSAKKAEIRNAEERIQRSLIAKQAGTATAEDERYFSEISGEILALREELRLMCA
ncbi:MAG: hypothetical protein Pg6C_17180 [Treponemataceae bacterium]|nr:MAG: hypothetical protein Pg6C_17180 [Treponemataceae bacterium]